MVQQLEWVWDQEACEPRAFQGRLEFQSLSWVESLREHEGGATEGRGYRQWSQENLGVISVWGRGEQRAIQMCLFVYKECLSTGAEKLAMD